MVDDKDFAQVKILRPSVTWMPRPAAVTLWPLELLVSGGRIDAIEHYTAFDIRIKIEIGKGEHHALTLSRAVKRLFDKALRNDKTRLRALISSLKQHGQLLLIVDQPTTIDTLPMIVDRAESILVAYLPDLAGRKKAWRTDFAG